MAKKTKQDAGDGATDRPKSSMDAVRRAMHALGPNAATQALHEHIQSEYGMNIINNKISAYKSSLRRQMGIKSTRGRKAAGGRPAGNTAAGIDLGDIRAVKHLAGRLGVGRLRELIDLLER